MDFSLGAQSTDSEISGTSRAYVVYDGTTGEILHIHHSVTFTSSAAEREDGMARARRLAGRKAGPDAQILEVDSAELSHRGQIRVDTARRAIIRDEPL